MAQQIETRAQFHERRRKGIGGSDVAAILGLDPYKTPEDLWMLKTGQTQPSLEESPDQRRGKLFEPIALREYFAKYPERVHVPGKEVGAHPSYPWMLYTTDGMELLDGEPDNGQSEGILEVKCPSLGKFSQIKREGLPDAWLLQMQHYLCCTGYKTGRWIIFCADRMELLDFPIEADPILHEMLIEKERAFWTLVETMSPPEPIVAEMREGKIQVVGKVEKRFDDEAVEAIRLLGEAKANKKTAELLEQEALDRFVEVVGDRVGVFEAPGVGRVNRSERTRKGSFDVDALAAAKPLDRIATMTAIMEAFEGVDNKHWLTQRVDSTLENCDLDLSKFQKPPFGYVEVRYYPSKGGE